jgi:hypothetical protein
LEYGECLYPFPFIETTDMFVGVVSEDRRRGEGGRRRISMIAVVLGSRGVEMLYCCDVVDAVSDVPDRRGGGIALYGNRI